LDSSQWDRLAPRIVEETGATVVSYDRAGLGASDLPTAPYDIREEVADLWRGLERLGLTDRLLVVGHSYGAFLIQLTAYEHPDAVIGLVYIDPNLPSFVDAIGGSEALLEIFGTPPQATTKLDRALRRQLDGFASSVSILRESPVLASVPVRVITAGQPWWPTSELSRAYREAHERLARSVPDGQLLVADRSGHMITETEPDIIVNVVRELVRASRVP
jgi:pimeloyl-ACP methyl ester carboxylesterase